MTTTGTAAGQTRFVGAGIWQRQVNGSTTIDGRISSFAYGVQTPNGTLPRTGAASFDVKLLGARTFSTNIYALGGTGKLSVDFLSGGIAGSGFYDETDVQTNVTARGYNWNAFALLSKSANSFLGQLTLGSAGTGELHGAFFGPNAEEVGAAFSQNPNSDVAATGVIYGARGTTPVNTSGAVEFPDSDQFFETLSASAKGTLSATGTLSGVSAGSGHASIYIGQNNSPIVFYGKDGRLAWQPRKAADVPLSYDFYNFGEYLRGGILIDRRTSLGQIDAFVYGNTTSDSAIPRSGSAAFNVALNGGLMANSAKIQSIAGQGSINVNFGTGAISTLGNYAVGGAIPGIGANLPGAQTDSGTWTGSGTLSSSVNNFSGNIAFDGTTDYNGTLAGKLFGPAAEKIGAVVQASNSSGAVLAAAITGTRGSDTTASQSGLAALTSTTVLRGIRAGYFYTPALNSRGAALNTLLEVTYNPTDKTYAVVSKGFNGSADQPLQTIAGSDLKPAESNSTFDVYQGADYTARVFKFGSGNPAIALTYSSFAQITRTNVVDGRETSAVYFVPFGGQTPSFQIPRTGTATYTGVVYGYGYNGATRRDASLSGTSSFSVNFETARGNVSMALTATDVANNARSDLGTFTYGGPLDGSCPGCGVSNGFNLSGSNPGVSGRMDGVFFGPNAAEWAGAFTLSITPNTGQQADISSFAGITLGKKN
ncbi:transferrin-binding protein-like solute binding protein [Novosphingobium subterraneum]|uniref:transferrin-binding protein-like solute binding protein n=1 Tax=Novosphingobium subterraneum TaxID=48936 RepID=UPI003CFE966A